MSRTLNLGRLEELKQQIYKLQVYVDTLAKGLIDVIGPIDMGMRYCGEIDMKKVKAIVHDMDKKVADLKKLITERDALQKELGDNE